MNPEMCSAVAACLTKLGIPRTSFRIVDGDAGQHLQVVQLDIFRIPDDGKVALFSAHLLRYTMTAFCEKTETVTEQSKKEHYDHCFGSDVLFLAAVVVQAAEPQFVAHSSFSLFSIDDQPAIGCVGSVCDPAVQGRGIATFLRRVAIQTTKACYFVTRSQNPKIFHITRKAVPPASIIYPLDCKTADDWLTAAGLAAQAIRQWTHVAPDSHCFDPSTLVFRCLYAPDRTAAFGGATSEATPAASAVPKKCGFDPASGDALLLIAAIPPVATT